MGVKSRPTVLRSRTYKQPTGHGTLYITIGYKKRTKPFEVFIALDKAGSCERAWAESLARICSLALRTGAKSEDLIKELSNIQCEKQIWDNGHIVQSPADGVSRVLREFVSGQDLDWKRRDGSK